MPEKPVWPSGSSALLTDLYELTMAYGYWKRGMADHEAVFHLFFRKNPFRGGFALASGLEPAIRMLRTFEFDDGSLAYLESLPGRDGRPLFEPGFLDWLGRMRLSCDIDAIPEGVPAFPQEPLLRVRGPIAQCQLLESALLNLLNFSTLIATKGARVSLAAGDDPVVEFGMRRAQGLDGAVTASRASYIGGCAGTSNTLAGKLYGIPVRGTQAHSWIMAFESEWEAFEAYAEALPANSIFLVDTYDTIEGVRNAIQAGKRLRERGYEMAGIRLDSGDLAALSREARRLLDESGFPDATILGSGDLDEYAIRDLKRQGARIGAWGVGTKLVTAYDDPALNGVYKLAAIRTPGGEWRYTIKLSEEAGKATLPGILQVRRFRDAKGFVADAIYAEGEAPGPGAALLDVRDFATRFDLPAGAEGEDLLQPVFRKGRLVYEVPPARQSREQTLRQLAALPGEVKRFESPQHYPVGLELRLVELREKLMRQAAHAQEKGTSP